MIKNFSEIIETLKSLDLSDKKIEELSTKPQIMQNLIDIMNCTDKFTRMHYSLACTAPKNTDLLRASKFIDKNLIDHDNMLRGLYKALENMNNKEVEKFISENNYSSAEIETAIKKMEGLSKKDLLREIKIKMPFADFKIVMNLLDNMTTKETADIKTEDSKDWLDEGEISRLTAPSDNKQASDEILKAHLARTGGKIVTRFPPEPNGSLHIGHAKALNLSFCYAQKFGGYTYLRYDDTNPKNECEEHFNSILEDVAWLGFKSKAVTHSSDYFEKMKDFSYMLIKAGKGYVCHCSAEDIKIRRKLFQEERDNGNTDPTIISPYRNRSIDDNLIEFNKMMKGSYAEGEAVFRFKMDLDSKNPLMLDLVGSRIINIVHPLKKINFVVYPSYEFALCVSDSLEDVTHSFCSREFYTRQEPYHWLLKNLGLYEPIQWEFSRLNLSNTVLSKRKLTEIINKGMMKWDDPRLYTIKGMRRRGFTPTSINRFVQSVGITFSETVIDIKNLENFVRDDLNKIANRVFCVKTPLKINIINFSKRSVEFKTGVDDSVILVEVNKTVYIEASDFSENPDSDFLRFTKIQPVGLINLGVIKFVDMVDDIINAQIVDEKPLKYIHWLPNLNNKVTLRLYSPLFKSFNPEELGYLNDLNDSSLETVVGFCDQRIVGAKPLDKFQFVRQGYFCCDYDSKPNDLIFNLTLPLKNVN